MRLQDFLDAQDLQMRVTYYPNQRGRWSACFERCEVVEGAMLRGAFGDGSTPAAAIRTYIREVRGHRMKYDGRYFLVPEHMEYTYP